MLVKGTGEVRSGRMIAEAGFVAGRILLTVEFSAANSDLSARKRLTQGVNSCSFLPYSTQGAGTASVSN